MKLFMKCVGDSGCQRNSTFSALLYSARLIIPTCLREEQRWSRAGEELRSNTSSLLHLYSVSALFFVHFLQKTNEQSSDETALQSCRHTPTEVHRSLIVIQVVSAVFSCLPMGIAPLEDCHRSGQRRRVVPLSAFRDFLI